MSIENHYVKDLGQLVFDECGGPHDARLRVDSDDDWRLQQVTVTATLPSGRSIVLRLTPEIAIEVSQAIRDGAARCEATSVCRTALECLDLLGTSASPSAVDALEFLIAHDLDDPLRKIRVCSECQRASCWQDAAPCENATGSNPTRLTIRQLLELGAEHPDYWRRNEPNFPVDSTEEVD